MKVDHFARIRSANPSFVKNSDKKTLENIDVPPVPHRENARWDTSAEKTSMNSSVLSQCPTVPHVPPGNIVLPQNFSACVLLLRHSFALEQKNAIGQQEAKTQRQEAKTQRTGSAHTHACQGAHLKNGGTCGTRGTSEKPLENERVLAANLSHLPKNQGGTGGTNAESGDVAARIAQLDAERNERDRLAKRGYDYDGRGDQSYQSKPGETVMRVFAHNHRVRNAAPDLLDPYAALGLTQLREAELDRLAIADTAQPEDVDEVLLTGAAQPTTQGSQAAPKTRGAHQHALSAETWSNQSVLEPRQERGTPSGFQGRVLN